MKKEKYLEEKTFRSGVLHIAFCTDENYVKYMGVAITSIILNNIDERLCFHIIYSGIQKEDQEKLYCLEKLYKNVQVCMYPFEEVKQVEKYKVGYHFTKAIFYRLFIPDIIPSNIKRLLYLDCDVLCLGNIARLFQMDLKGFAVMAICYFNSTDMKRLNIQTTKTLSSGELLIDMEMWRKQDITGEVLQILDKRHTEFPWVDQDALNCYFSGAFMEMPIEYGKAVDCAVDFPKEITKEDKIVHYVGSVKPWKAICFSEKKEIWWEYARKSFWYALKPEEPKKQQEVVFMAKKLALLGRYQDAIRYYDAVVNYFIHQKQS